MPPRPQLSTKFAFPSAKMATPSSTPPVSSTSEKSSSDSSSRIQKRKVIPPPPSQSPWRQFVDRKVTIVMQALGLV